MKSFCCLLLVCSGGGLVAETNLALVPRQLLSIPPAELRALNPDSNRQTPAVAADSDGLLLGSAPERDLVLRPEVEISVKAVGEFEATSASGAPSGFPWAIYDRLERGGYLTRPELPSENRLERFVTATFAPEVIQFRKASLSCSLITAIKRRNPLCLLNPIFLDLRW